MKTGTTIVLYDDLCPMCASQMRLLSRLDWFGLTTPIPMLNPEVSRIAPTLTREDLQAAMHCVTGNGRLYRGARCFRYVCLRTPLLLPLALLLWLPGAMWIAERIYGAVSRNRYHLSRFFGCDTACAVPPPGGQPKNNTVAKPANKS